MIFGLSFGASSTKDNQTVIANKTDNLTGQTNTTTQGSQSSTGTTTGTQSTTQTGNQNQTGNTSQTGTTSGTQQQSQTTTSLSSDVQNALSNAVKTTLSGGVTSTNIAALSNMIAGRTGFNADGFVNDQVTAATQRGQENLQESNSAFQSAVGGSAATNSMAALLGQRGSQDLAASIAGVRAQAEQTAAGIQNQNLSTAASAQGTINTSGTYLADALKGASVTSDASTLTSQLNQLLGSNSGNTNTSQNASTATAQQTSTNQLISQIVSALTSQQDVSSGTQNTTGSTTKLGGGFSLGI